MQSVGLWVHNDHNGRQGLHTTSKSSCQALQSLEKLSTPLPPHPRLPENEPIRTGRLLAGSSLGESHDALSQWPVLGRWVPTAASCSCHSESESAGFLENNQSDKYLICWPWAPQIWLNRRWLPFFWRCEGPLMNTPSLPAWAFTCSFKRFGFPSQTMGLRVFTLTVFKLFFVLSSHFWSIHSTISWRTGK